MKLHRQLWLLTLMVASVFAENEEEANSTTTSPVVTIPPLETIGAFIPYPNGPFYGMPYPLQTTMSRMLPFSVSGRCLANVQYTINSLEDFANYADQFECIYNTGNAPRRVPLGAVVAAPMSIINTRLFNPFISQAWKGMMINNDTNCNGDKNKFIGYQNINNSPFSPFIARIGYIREYANLAPGEYDDGFPSLIMAHVENIRQECPEHFDQLGASQGRAVEKAAEFTNLNFIMQNMVSALRVVGKTKDGDVIYIGKTYMRDPFRDDKQAVTIQYFAAVSSDRDAAGVLGIDVNPIRISVKEFKYMIPGIVDLLMRLDPLDNMISQPARTLSKISRGAVRFGQGVFGLASSLPFGYGKVQNNIRKFRNRFRSRQRYVPAFTTEETVQITLRPRSTVAGRRRFF